ncbi:MAG: diacylglycerol/lipid kinase family protein [Lachnospiraceae bacterium]
MKLQFIVNPASRSGKGIEIWKEAEKVLKSSEIPYEVYFTKRAGHATEIAGQLTRKPGKLKIIALGGDGTVNEVINGIVRLKDTVFGYIPTGSGNDFAAGLKLETDAMTAIEHILDEREHLQMNVGILEAEDQKRRFAVSCGMGWDAAICHEAIRSRIKRLLNKMKLGKLCYVGIALKQIIRFRKIPMQISIDQKSKIKLERAYFTAVMNGPYQGGKLKLCPNASWSDDLLDVCMIGDLPKLKLCALLPTAYSGLHRFFKGVTIKRGETVVLKTERPAAIHCDGENFGYYNEIRVSLEKEKLCVIR